MLAGSLAFLMNRQRDATGLIAFDDRIRFRLPAGSRPGHLHAPMMALEKMQPGSQSDVAHPLHQLAEALVKRSLVVVISDLLDDPEPVVRALRHLRFRGTDVIVFQLLDPHELTFPFRGPSKFRDLESAEAIVAERRQSGRLISASWRDSRCGWIGSCAVPGSTTYSSTHRSRWTSRCSHIWPPGSDGSRHVSWRSSIRIPARRPRHRIARVAAPVAPRRCPEVPFTAVRLLRQSPIDRTRRRRLRDLLLLAARVAALTLLALAFARPYFTQASPLPRVRIVALDRSFSMGAPGQFARALAQAREAVGQAGIGERVAVIAFDERADVIAQPGPAGDAGGAGRAERRFRRDAVCACGRQSR